MAVIIGRSGTGKSALAKTAYHRVKLSGGYFCKGKIDMNNRSDPYKAISEAFGELMVQIASDKDHLCYCQRKIQKTLGKDIAVLFHVFPFMKILQNDELDFDDTEETKTLDGSFISNHTQVDSNNASSDITNRAAVVQNLVIEILRILCTEKYPVTFLLDDIQWAGQTMIDFLESVLDNPNLHHFCIISTCRLEYFEMIDKERTKSIEENKSLQEGCATNKHVQLLLEKFKNEIQEIRIDGLSLDSVQNITNALLRISDEYDDSTVVARAKNLAKIVHSKTGGNPFFVLAFMQALVEEELLKYNMSTMAWEWFEVEIQSRNVADNIAQAVSKRLQRLSSQDLFVLQISACLSLSIDQPTLRYILLGLEESQDGETQVSRSNDSISLAIFDEWVVKFTKSIDDSICHLEEMGMLEKRWGGHGFVFAHDHIQHAAVQSIPTRFQVRLKMRIGRLLLDGMDEFHFDRYLFTAVQLYGSGCSDERVGKRDRRSFSFWCYIAGNHAMRQGAFPMALKCFQQSIICLGKSPFQKDSDLAVSLFSGIVQAAYCCGNGDLALEYALTLHHEKDIELVKKYRVILTEMRVYGGRRDYEKAVGIFRDLLKGLGVGKLPKKANMISLIYQLMTTVRKVHMYNRQKLLELPICTDQKIIAATHAFSSARSGSQTQQPTSMNEDSDSYLDSLLGERGGPRCVGFEPTESSDSQSFNRTFFSSRANGNNKPFHRFADHQAYRSEHQPAAAATSYPGTYATAPPDFRARSARSSRSTNPQQKL